MSGFEVIKLGQSTKQVLNISDELDKPIIKAICNRSQTQCAQLCKNSSKEVKSFGNKTEISTQFFLFR